MAKTRKCGPALSSAKGGGGVAARLDQPDRLSASVFESLTDFAVFVVSPGGTVVSWNSGAERIFGYTAAEIVGRNFEVFFTPADIGCDVPSAELRAATQHARAHSARWHVRKDQTQFWGTNTVQPIFDGMRQSVIGFAKIVRDITPSYLEAQALHDSEQRLRLLLESVRGHAIFSLGLDGCVLTWTAGAELTFGLTAAQIVGRSASILLPADDCNDDILASELAGAVSEGHVSTERWLVRSDGSRIFVSWKMSVLKAGPDGRSHGFVVIAHDITEAARRNDEIRQRADRDALTQLPNRSAFYAHVTRAIAAMAARGSHRFGVLFIDLDQFKTVNDKYGHLLADRILEHAARRLEGGIRSRDILARLGGDEFAVLLNGIEGRSDAVEAGDRLLGELAQPMDVEGFEVVLTASIGIALGTAEHECPEHVLADADAAMYAAKVQGRGRTVVYEDAMSLHNRRALQIETDLRTALNLTQFRLLYAPIRALHDDRLVGFEAQVRWDHPVFGALEPADFNAGAEATSAIVAIERWIFERACEQLAAWRELLAGDLLHMIVHFSSQQFTRPDLAASIAPILSRNGIDAASMRIALGGARPLDYSARSRDTMARIGALGVGLLIDGFAMGGSLDVLGHVPAVGLRIDRSFAAELADPHGRNLARSIVAFGHSLDLTITAEGVRTPAELAQLKDIGCDFALGPVVSRPLDAAAATELLTRYEARGGWNATARAQAVGAEG